MEQNMCGHRLKCHKVGDIKKELGICKLARTEICPPTVGIEGGRM